MSASVAEFLPIETALPGVLARDELDLHYQPQIDTATGCVVGVEALMRWNHPQMGVIAPVRFIPLLEHAGLTDLVTEWMLARACRDVLVLEAQTGRSLQLAVNLSRGQSACAGLADIVSRVLCATAFDPSRLELEITEDTLMLRAACVENTLHALADLRLRLAVDDFGTGASSLACLKRFGIRTLKIDRSFVCALAQSEGAATVIRGILSLADSLGLDVVAEGVETGQQLAFLERHGCRLAQGYLFSRPLARAALESRLRYQA